MSNTTFQAAVLFETNSPLVLCDLEIPALETGQVLIKMHYSGVCRSQLMEVKGLRGVDPWLPHLLGHEGMGTVLEIGPHVTKVEVGQEVIIGWIKSGGIQAANPKFRSGQHVINAGSATTFSELTVVSENRVYAKPEFVSDKVSVLFGCALLTGSGMVLNELPPQDSDSVVVLGLGGVGMSALVGAICSSPRLLIAADISEPKRKLALEMGAHAALDPLEPSFLSQLHDLTAGGADKCYESAGSTRTIELALDCVRPFGGQVLFASHPPAGDRVRIDPFDLIQGKQLRGSWGGGSDPEEDIPHLANLVEKHGIRLEKLVSRPYSLAGINDALRDLDRGHTVRAVVSHITENYLAPE